MTSCLIGVALIICDKKNTIKIIIIIIIINITTFFITGMSCLLAGVIITAMDMIFPHSFSTILEVDYDTPYDRHVIIEESFETQLKDFDNRISHSRNSSNNQLIR